MLEEVLGALCFVEEVGKVGGDGDGGKKGGKGGRLNLVNVRTMFGETPLHKACEGRGDPAIVKFLLDRGADLKAVTKLGLFLFKKS